MIKEIYLAPLQGYTDRFYRNTFPKYFSGIAHCFTPYISFHKRQLVSNKLKEVQGREKDILPTTPQVLCNTPEELNMATDFIITRGYDVVNLNLGCPYPMVAKKGLGSGLLQSPEILDSMLASHFELNKSALSIKLRAGYEDPLEFIRIIKIINKYPVKELIFHPRTGKQLYKGKADTTLFGKLKQETDLPLVYNGDINTLDDLKQLMEHYPNLEKLMIGRGFLMNPFFADEIVNQKQYNQEEKKELLIAFVRDMYYQYEQLMENDSHLLHKLRAFWEYLAYITNNQHKAFKLIKKANTSVKYTEATRIIFSKYL
jgi:tRNA-dihydrouridine synthase